VLILQAAHSKACLSPGFLYTWGNVGLVLPGLSRAGCVSRVPPTTVQYLDRPVLELSEAVSALSQYATTSHVVILHHILVISAPYAVVTPGTSVSLPCFAHRMAYIC
jgi:hypothetical protein